MPSCEKAQVRISASSVRGGHREQRLVDRGRCGGVSGHVVGERGEAGATWQPIEDIRLRVTSSRDIRDPKLNELSATGSANSVSVRNPAYTNDGADGPATFGYSTTVTGNPDLRPEKSDSCNIGGVLTPRFLPSFNLAVDSSGST